MGHNGKLDKLQRNLHYDKIVQTDRLRDVELIFNSMIEKIDILLKMLKKMNETDKSKQ